MADFKINRIRFTWKAEWATATAYTKDDIVRYGGKSYVCLVGHAASADFNTDLNYINTATDPDTAAPKWVLWFDGYTWKDDWQVSTFYKLGDIVQYGSIVYICNVSHTSASTLALGLELNQSSWASYAVTDDWKSNWTASTRYKLNDIVRHGATIYRANVGHTSGLFLEVDQGNWNAITYGSDWKTDWLTSTRYRLGDVVRYGAIIYKCTAMHTSAATTTLGIDPDIASWTIVHRGIEYKSLWTQPTRYKLNDIVKYGADLYICTTAHTSSAVFDTASFTVWVPGLEYATTWDISVSYIKGDVVTYGGYQYTSNTTNNFGNVPSVDAVDWTILVTNYNIKGDWNDYSNYKTGDLVRRGGYLYVAIADSISVETTATASWTLVNPGMQWRNRWANGISYVIGDVVTFYSSAYICVVKHLSITTPLADDGTNWVLYIRGDQFDTLQNLGDIQTYNNSAPAGIVVGKPGTLLQVQTTLLPVAAWDSWGVIGKVYYVAPTGLDIGNGLDAGTYGTTISTPWATVKYACQNVIGPATINIKTGTYGESLPISVPAGVALVGDELRGTVIQPARSINCIAVSSSSATNLITVNTTVGIRDNDNIQFVTATLSTTATLTAATGNKITVGQTIGMYINMPIVFTGTSFGNIESGTVYYVSYYDAATQTISVATSYNGSTLAVSNAFGTMTVLAGSFAGLTIGQTYYVIGSSITPTQFSVSNTSFSTVPVQLTDTTARTVAVFGGDAIKDMFYVRNGTGIRNMTVKGLLGGLGSANLFGTQRPTGGAYVSLDPGTGPSDATAQITTKSPYVQNVTTFGQGCTGLKIDGSLHTSGNKSIVANDFTQIISDGIGVWCTGTNALTELVSVFSYYGHCGYLAEAGGRIRATNGNTSYGTYGCVAEGYDVAEASIGGTVNNQNQQAQIVAAFIGEATNKLLKLEFSNAGQGYTSASFAFSGSGMGAVAIADEFRDGGIFEARITGTDFAAGGLGYISAGNQAQAGDLQSITIASNDQNTLANYYGMRVIVTSGTGVGQYGYVAYFNQVSKYVTIAKESIAIRTSSATSASTNTILADSTTGLSIGQAIAIVPVQQTTTAYNTVHTVAVMSSAYIAGSTLFVTSMGAGAIAVGMVLTGVGVTANTYITANNTGSGSGSTWTVSVGQAVGSASATIAITGTNNLVTLTSSAGMIVGERITFSGVVFGGVVSGTIYYISTIFGNQVAVSATSGGPVLSVSNATGVMTAVAGGMVGGLVAGQIYYIIASNYSNTAFSVSSTLNGAVLPLTTDAGGVIMQICSVGWENIVAGTPSVALLDSTSVYSIEPSLKFSAPAFTASSATLPTSSTWVGATYGKGIFVAISSAGASATSATGQSWTAGSLISGNPSAIAYGNNVFVSVSLASTISSYSPDGSSWNSATTPVAVGLSAVAYGNNTFIAVPASGATGAATGNGSSWNSITLPVSAAWTGVAYGSIGTWVAIAGTASAVAAYSIDGGSNWVQVALPTTANWASVVWGAGRFVAIATGSSASAYSFDGITWYPGLLPAAQGWSAVRYGQGLFFAVANGSTIAATSQDGQTWLSRALPSASTWSAIAFGNPSYIPTWAVVSTTASTSALYITTGATAFGRASVASNKISVIKIIEPGSGYTFAPAPSLTIVDPNPTSVAVTVCRIANGVLGNPTFTNRGTGYRTSTTVVQVSGGTGFASIYQSSKYLTVSGLSSMPTPGAALTILGNPNQYRIVLINDLGSGTAQFQVSPPLSILLAPEHNSSISIRQKYSQCRITGHDFLLIGTGNQITSNYPNTDVTTANAYQQILETNGGRVFQTSTDQDGNFKVGNLFAVQQASGIVTISADQLSLTGLQTISLGGFSLGTNTVVVTQFSTDSYFTANSDTIVPTQKAIKSYIARNIAGGGANAQAGAVVAGTFGIGAPNKIYSSTQTQVVVKNSMNIKKGINGTMLSKSFFHSGFKSGN